MTIFSMTPTNPGAEAGSAAGWTVYSGDGTLAATAIEHHTGSFGFGISGNFRTDTNWGQQVAVDASVEAAIDAGTCAARGSAWLRADLDSGAYYISFIAANGTTVISTSTLQAAIPSSWVQKEQYLHIPALTRFIRVGTVNVRIVGSIFNVFWDDFELELSNAPETDWPAAFAPLAHQATTYVWGTFPSASIRVSQAPIYTLAASEGSSGLFRVKAHQAAVYVWARPRLRRRRMQAWTFSLDGHDFYVLNLADEATIVCDLATGQWSEWRSMDRITWRARIGQNWLGLGPDTADRLYGTNVVVGDDTDGILWILDPTQGFDDATAADGDDAPFVRYVTGLVPMRMRETQSCAAVYLNLSLGAPTVTGAAIQLRTSDDGGQTYYDHGSVTITPGDYSQEVAWRGLGLIRAQGRIFEFTDSGAAVRINAANMA